MASDAAIACSKLSKDYGRGRGLFDANLIVRKGEIFGLIGPNGAGKSTLLKLLMDLIRPTSGSASIFDQDSRNDSLSLKREIGYLPGEPMQFPGVTAGYILTLLANLRQMTDLTYIEELARRFQLNLEEKYQDLSHGNKQKVGIIQCLMHRPKLLIMDEPTLGLDPIMQRELRTLIVDSKARGSTVLLSSHVLSEVESICSRMALIDEGRIRREGTLDELRTARIHMVRALLKGKVPSTSGLMDLGLENVTVEGQEVLFEVRGSIDKAIKSLALFEVIELDSRELSLEEVFFSEIEG